MTKYIISKTWCPEMKNTHTHTKDERCYDACFMKQ